MPQQLSLSLFLILTLTNCSQPECPTIAIKTWSTVEERQAASEVAALPDNSILVPMLEDYARIRREVQ